MSDLDRIAELATINPTTLDDANELLDDILEEAQSSPSPSLPSEEDGHQSYDRQEGVYAVVTPATCGGRIELECAIAACDNIAGNVIYRMLDDGSEGVDRVDIPVCSVCCNQYADIVRRGEEPPDG